MYIQDIFETGDLGINSVLSNALLNFAYRPSLVSSLVNMNGKPQFTLNTILYVLVQTFRIIKETSFIQPLFEVLFSDQIVTVKKMNCTDVVQIDTDNDCKLNR